MFKSLLEKSNYGEFVGMTFDDIKGKKEEYIDMYNTINKEIFGQELNLKDEEVYDELLNYAVVDIEAEFVSRINKNLEEKGKRFKIATLQRSAIEQLTEQGIDNVVETLITYIKSLCSSEKEQQMMEKYIDENLNKEELLKDIGTSFNGVLIDEIDLFYKEIEESIEEVKKDIKSSFELAKDKKENQQVGEEQAEIFKAKANFVPNQQPQQPVDVQYTEVPKQDINNEDPVKKGLLNNIEDCTAYYYNKDRVLSMIGGQVNLLNDIMNKILETCNKMTQLVETSYGAMSVGDIKNKLSSMQLELTNMIQSFNPNNKNDMNIIINSFKAIQVDSEGNPIIFEDFFGNKINACDIKVNRPEPINQYDNSKILAKYVELIPVIAKISEMGVQVNLKEMKSVYKHISPVVRADLFINGQSLNKPLVFDTNGVLFNEVQKVLLVPQNGIEEDGVVLSLDNIEILQRYIYGSISNEELMKYDIIDEELRIMNRVVDLSSMIPQIRKCVLHVLNQKASKQALNATVAFDEDVRFKLNKWISEEDFELISNSSVRKSFFGTTCRRKKQIIKFVKGELSVGH